MKFGGSSVADGERIRDVAKLIKAQPKSKAVVVSAMGGVTDSLMEIANSVVNLSSATVEREVDGFCRELSVKQRKAIMAAVSNKRVRGSVLSDSLALIDRLRVALLGVGYLEDLSPRSMDYIVSFGERLNSKLVSAALSSINVKSVALTGQEAGLLTDSCFGRARPNHSKSKKCVAEVLGKLIKAGTVPVVTGFIAADDKARITTLGRGGSDYTASLLGKYLKAKEVQIWTDVDGILSTDPRLVPHAKLIPTLSYSEAMDLAYYGAKVIHSKMIEPAMKSRIPVRVKNTFNPECEGTLIVKTQRKVKHIVKAVAISKDVVVVNIEGFGMVETPNIAGQLFSALGEQNINISMISGSSESNLSFVIADEDLERALNILGERLGRDITRNFSTIKDVSIVTVVGAGMRGSKGIAARVFGTVADLGVNLIMIAQGSSELNIAFVIRSQDVRDTVQAIHERFIE